MKQFVTLFAVLALASVQVASQILGPQVVSGLLPLANLPTNLNLPILPNLPVLPNLPIFPEYININPLIDIDVPCSSCGCAAKGKQGCTCAGSSTCSCSANKPCTCSACSNAVVDYAVPNGILGVPSVGVAPSCGCGACSGATSSCGCGCAQAPAIQSLVLF